MARGRPPRMSIGSNGNIGISTLTPATNLKIQKPVDIEEPEFIDFRSMTIEEARRYSKYQRILSEGVLYDLNSPTFLYSDEFVWVAGYFFIENETFYILDARTTKKCLAQLGDLTAEGTPIIEAIKTIRTWTEL